MNLSFHKTLIALTIFVSCCFPITIIAQNYSQYVNPMVGTGAHGHTFPGAIVPFGAVQLSPDTRLTGWDGCSAYHYDDNVIYGFSHTHLSGTGCSDYGDILIMPFSGTGSPKNSQYCSPFSHEEETACPGYYSVKLRSSGILAELTATPHVGVHRYTFPDDGKEHGIIVDLGHRDIVLESQIEIISKQEVEGFRISRAWSEEQHAYFSMMLSEPITRIQLYRDSTMMRTIDKLGGTNVKAILYFDSKVRQLTLNVGISAVDCEGARANLEETPNFDFNQVRENANKLWNKELGKIEVTGNENDMRIFYTALYHCFTAPYEYSDVDGRYRGQDAKIHLDSRHKVYTVFSLWDTYRALHPLLNIIDQKRTNDFLNTFLLAYRQGGQLPMWELSAYETWCMIGYHAIPVILDASRKGIGDFDKKEMLKAMVASAELPKLGRPEFEKYEYIPADKEHESVSKTLEYCYDDWCIAQFAHDLGDTKTEQRFLKRSQFYKNILDENGFMHPRSNGGFILPFEPGEVNNHFTEANSWQYSTYVPHDFNHYVEIVGEKRARSILDSLFFGNAKMSGRQQADLTGIMGQYAHGNEPGHHAPYMYNYLGEAWKTQQVVRQLLREQYQCSPDGLCGNEDCGQMSAWYVMSAMGIYAVAPGSNHYDIGSPIFNEVKIHLENGKTFTIVCHNQSSENIYIQSIKHNGELYHSAHIDYSMIANGDTFEFEMGKSPQKNLTSNSGICSVEPTLVTTPTFADNTSVFHDQQTISLHNPQHYPIYYSSSADNFKKVHLYKKPFVIKETTTLRAYCENSHNKAKSAVVEATFHKFVQDKSVKINSIYNPQYTAGGPDGLIDALRGSVNWRLGGWQGYQDQDFDAVVDLQKVKDIHAVSVGFLEDIRAWIWYPTEMVVEVSLDGNKFSLFGKFTYEGPDNDYTVKMQDFLVKGSAKARYIRIRAKNYGTLPEWHLGAGGAAFIFVDEIVIE